MPEDRVGDLVMDLAALEPLMWSHGLPSEVDNGY